MDCCFDVVGWIWFWRMCCVVIVVGWDFDGCVLLWWCFDWCGVY